MTREEKVSLEDILSAFSLRERQSYILHRGGASEEHLLRI